MGLSASIDLELERHANAGLRPTHAIFSQKSIFLDQVYSFPTRSSSTARSPGLGGSGAANVTCTVQPMVAREHQDNMNLLTRPIHTST